MKIVNRYGEQLFKVKMDYGNGDHAWLDCTKYTDSQNKEVIYFGRNKDGVHAWHCNSLPINDCRILEIREK